MAQIVVRRRRVIDDLNRTRLIAKLEGAIGDDAILQSEEWEWVSLVTATERIDGYEMPNPLGTQESITERFYAYLELDADLVTEWKKIYNAAQRPANAAALVPANSLTDEEKKSTPPSEAQTA